jgi:hypothetical protein
VTNFEILVSNPNAKRRTAYYWMATVGIILSLINVLFFANFLQRLIGGPPKTVLVISSFILICSLPLIALTSIFGLVLAVTPQNSLATLLGGKGNLDQLIYAEATFSAPLLLISNILGSVPYLYLLNVPLGIYSFVLSVMAIKAIHQFGWLKAIVSSLAVLILAVIVAIIVFVVLSTRGVAIKF